MNIFPRLLSFSALISVMVIAMECNSKEKRKIAYPVEKNVRRQNTDSAHNDTADYIKRIRALNNSDTSQAFPNNTIYPSPGALLPYRRVIAFYGNLYSKKMGILGELPKKEMLKQLQDKVSQWQLADPGTPTMPALHYVAITAQRQPGKNNKYRLRMPFRQIDTIMAWADSINALVFLDVQAGQSPVREEVYSLYSYLKLPNVHLAIDPEFVMKNGEVPGTK